IGHRWFPDFSIESAFVLFDASYLELASPSGSSGLFGERLERSGPGLVFGCIRPRDEPTLRSALANPDLRFGPPQTIRAAKARGHTAVGIGTAYTLSRKSASGLMLTIFDTDWPWASLQPTS